MITRSTIASAIATVGTLAFSSSALAITVEEAVSDGCSTTQVEGLSLQIIAQGNCITPGAFVEVPNKANTTFGAAVLPYMEEPARDALVAALEANSALDMQVNSMLRTVAQQYLLYRWYQLGTCGIGLAATPGNSNHETGLAIDIQQYDDWITALESADFAWFGAGDPVHFDYVGPGAIDYKGTDVLAFQQLWNINEPSDLIAEDGLYGPQTEARLEQTSADGFAIGPDCGDPEPPDPDPVSELVLSADWVGLSDLFSDGPSAGVVDTVEGASLQLALTVENTGEGDSTAFTLILTPDEHLSVNTTELGLDALPSGSSEMLQVDVTALSYSVATLPPAYVDISLDDTTITAEIDVYSLRRWTFDGERREGWTGGEISDGVLALTGPSAEITAQSPLLSIALGEDDDVELAARRHSDDGVARLYFITDADPEYDEHKRFDLELPGDGEWHTLVVRTTEHASFHGVLTGLRFLPYDESTAGENNGAELDALSIGGLPPPFEQITGSNEACSCRAPGRDSRHLNTRALLALFAAAALFRRRAHSAMRSSRRRIVSASSAKDRNAG